MVVTSCMVWSQSFDSKKIPGGTHIRLVGYNFISYIGRRFGQCRPTYYFGRPTYLYLFFSLVVSGGRPIFAGQSYFFLIPHDHCFISGGRPTTHITFTRNKWLRWQPASFHDYHMTTVLFRVAGQRLALNLLEHNYTEEQNTSTFLIVCFLIKNRFLHGFGAPFGARYSTTPSRMCMVPW